MIEYQGFKIVFKPDTNQYVIIDSKFNQEIKCKNVQACKLRITKLINTRNRLGI